jgi:hypothetical protein
VRGAKLLPPVLARLNPPVDGLRFRDEPPALRDAGRSVLFELQEELVFLVTVRPVGRECEAFLTVEAPRLGRLKLFIYFFVSRTSTVSATLIKKQK